MVRTRAVISSIGHLFQPCLLALTTRMQMERRKKKAKGEGSVVRNAKTQRSERVNGNGRGVSMVPKAEPSGAKEAWQIVNMLRVFKSFRVAYICSQLVGDDKIRAA